MSGEKLHVGNEEFKVWLKNLAKSARVQVMTELTRGLAKRGVSSLKISEALIQLSQRCCVMLMELPEKDIKRYTRYLKPKRLQKVKEKSKTNYTIRNCGVSLVNITNEKDNPSKLIYKIQCKESVKKRSKKERKNKRINERCRELFGEDFDGSELESKSARKAKRAKVSETSIVDQRSDRDTNLLPKNKVQKSVSLSSDEKWNKMGLPSPSQRSQCILNATMIESESTSVQEMLPQEECSRPKIGAIKVRSLSELTNERFHETPPNDPKFVERTFLIAYNSYFNDQMEDNIKKLGELLWLAGDYYVQKNDRIERTKQLSSDDLAMEEKQRAELNFSSLIRYRGNDFAPLFLDILNKFEASNRRTLFIALFCRIMHHAQSFNSDNVGPSLNSSYIALAREVISLMISNYQPGYEIFEDLELDLDLLEMCVSKTYEVIFPVDGQKISNISNDPHQVSQQSNNNYPIQQLTSEVASLSPVASQLTDTSIQPGLDKPNQMNVKKSSHKTSDSEPRYTFDFNGASKTQGLMIAVKDSPSLIEGTKGQQNITRQSTDALSLQTQSGHFHTANSQGVATKNKELPRLQQTTNIHEILNTQTTNEPCLRSLLGSSHSLSIQEGTLNQDVQNVMQGFNDKNIRTSQNMSKSPSLHINQSEPAPYDSRSTFQPDYSKGLSAKYTPSTNLDHLASILMTTSPATRYANTYTFGTNPQDNQSIVMSSQLSCVTQTTTTPQSYSSSLPQHTKSNTLVQNAPANSQMTQSAQNISRPSTSYLEDQHRPSNSQNVTGETIRQIRAFTTSSQLVALTPSLCPENQSRPSCIKNTYIVQAPQLTQSPKETVQLQPLFSNNQPTNINVHLMRDQIKSRLARAPQRPLISKPASRPPSNHLPTYNQNRIIKNVQGSPVETLASQQTNRLLYPSNQHALAYNPNIQLQKCPQPTPAPQQSMARNVTSHLQYHYRPIYNASAYNHRLQNSALRVAPNVAANNTTEWISHCQKQPSHAMVSTQNNQIIPQFSRVQAATLAQHIVPRAADLQLFQPLPQSVSVTVAAKTRQLPNTTSTDVYSRREESVQQASIALSNINQVAVELHP